MTQSLSHPFLSRDSMLRWILSGLVLFPVLGCEPAEKLKPTNSADTLLSELSAEPVNKISQADSVAAKAAELLKEPKPNDITLPQINDSRNDAILKVTSVPKEPERVTPQADDPSTPWMLDSSESLSFWELMYQANSPVGYSSRKVFLSKFGESKNIKSELTSVTRVSKDGKAMKQTLKLTTVEKTNGALINLMGSIEIGSNKREIIVTVDDGVLTLMLDDNGNKKQETLIWRDDFRGPFAVEQSLSRRPLKEKEARVLRYLDPLSGHLVETRLEALSRHSSPTMKGRSMPLREIRSVTRDGERISESKLWMDDDGAILKSYNPSLDLRSFQVDEERASEFRLVSDLKFVERFQMPFAIKESQRTLYDEAVFQLDQVVYRLQMKNVDPFSLLSKRTNQRIKSLDAVTSEITVFRIGPLRDLPAGVERQDVSLAADLANSPWLDIGSPIVDQLYVDVTEHSEDKDQKQRVAFLAKRLYEKYQTTEFDKQVRRLSVALKSESLNSVEHAMAMIATLRKDKIPARMALGYLFNQSESTPAFVLHAWVEFYSDDRWHAIDSSVPGRQSLLDRIKLKEIRSIDSDLLADLTAAANLCANGSISFVP
jgi:hypothetical protein